MADLSALIALSGPYQHQQHPDKVRTAAGAKKFDTPIGGDILPGEKLLSALGKAIAKTGYTAPGGATFQVPVGSTVYAPGAKHGQVPWLLARHPDGSWHSYSTLTPGGYPLDKAAFDKFAVTALADGSMAEVHPVGAASPPEPPVVPAVVAPPAIPVAGLHITSAQLDEAIAILEKAKGVAIAQPLAKGAGHPLAGADYKAYAKAFMPDAPANRISFLAYLHAVKDGTVGALVIKPTPSSKTKEYQAAKKEAKKTGSAGLVEALKPAESQHPALDVILPGVAAAEAKAVPESPPEPVKVEAPKVEEPAKPEPVDYKGMDLAAITAQAAKEAEAVKANWVDQGASSGGGGWGGVANLQPGYQGSKTQQLAEKTAKAANTKSKNAHALATPANRIATLVQGVTQARGHLASVLAHPQVNHPAVQAQNVKEQQGYIDTGLAKITALGGDLDALFPKVEAPKVEEPVKVEVPEAPKVKPAAPEPPKSVVTPAKAAALVEALKPVAEPPKVSVADLTELLKPVTPAAPPAAPAAPGKTVTLNGYAYTLQPGDQSIKSNGTHGIYVVHADGTALLIGANGTAQTLPSTSGAVHVATVKLADLKAGIPSANYTLVDIDSPPVQLNGFDYIPQPGDIAAKTNGGTIFVLHADGSVDKIYPAGGKSFYYPPDSVVADNAKANLAAWTPVPLGQGGVSLHPGKIQVAGMMITPAELDQAISTLQSSKGIMIKQPLAKVGNPLAGSDYHLYSKAHDPQSQAKPAYLAYLKHVKDQTASSTASAPSTPSVPNTPSAPAKTAAEHLADAQAAWDDPSKLPTGAAFGSMSDKESFKTALDAMPVGSVMVYRFKPSYIDPGGPNFEVITRDSTGWEADVDKTHYPPGGMWNASDKDKFYFPAGLPAGFSPAVQQAPVAVAPAPALPEVALNGKVYQPHAGDLAIQTPGGDIFVHHPVGSVTQIYTNGHTEEIAAENTMTSQPGETLAQYQIKKATDGTPGWKTIPLDGSAVPAAPAAVAPAAPAKVKLNGTDYTVKPGDIAVQVKGSTNSGFIGNIYVLHTDGSVTRFHTKLSDAPATTEFAADGAMAINIKKAVDQANKPGGSLDWKLVPLDEAAPSAPVAPSAAAPSAPVTMPNGKSYTPLPGDEAWKVKGASHSGVFVFHADGTAHLFSASGNVKVTTTTKSGLGDSYEPFDLGLPEASTTAAPVVLDLNGTQHVHLPGDRYGRKPSDWAIFITRADGSAITIWEDGQTFPVPAGTPVAEQRIKDFALGYITEFYPLGVDSPSKAPLSVLKINGTDYDPQPGDTYHRNSSDGVMVVHQDGSGFYIATHPGSSITGPMNAQQVKDEFASDHTLVAFVPDGAVPVAAAVKILGHDYTPQPGDIAAETPGGSVYILHTDGSSTAYGISGAVVENTPAETKDKDLVDVTTGYLASGYWTPYDLGPVAAPAVPAPAAPAAPFVPKTVKLNGVNYTLQPGDTAVKKKASGNIYVLHEGGSATLIKSDGIVKDSLASSYGAVPDAMAAYQAGGNYNWDVFDLGSAPLASAPAVPAVVTGPLEDEDALQAHAAAHPGAVYQGSDGDKWTVTPSNVDGFPIHDLQGHGHYHSWAAYPVKVVSAPPSSASSLPDQSALAAHAQSNPGLSTYQGYDGDQWAWDGLTSYVTDMTGGTHDVDDWAVFPVTVVSVSNPAAAAQLVDYNTAHPGSQAGVKLQDKAAFLAHAASHPGTFYKDSSGDKFYVEHSDTGSYAADDGMYLQTPVGLAHPGQHDIGWASWPATIWHEGVAPSHEGHPPGQYTSSVGTLSVLPDGTSQVLNGYSLSYDNTGKLLAGYDWTPAGDLPDNLPTLPPGSVTEIDGKPVPGDVKYVTAPDLPPVPTGTQLPAGTYYRPVQQQKLLSAQSVADATGQTYTVDDTGAMTYDSWGSPQEVSPEGVANFLNDEVTLVDDTNSSVMLGPKAKEAWVYGVKIDLKKSKAAYQTVLHNPDHTDAQVYQAVKSASEYSGYYSATWETVQANLPAGTTFEQQLRRYIDAPTNEQATAQVQLQQLIDAPVAGPTDTPAVPQPLDGSLYDPSGSSTIPVLNTAVKSWAEQAGFTGKAGKLVGASPEVKKAWLKAWYVGDFAKAYEIEKANFAAQGKKPPASFAKSHPGSPTFPGGNAKVNYAPQYPAQTPAGVLLPPDPYLPADYLLHAQTSNNPTYYWNDEDKRDAYLLGSHLAGISSGLSVTDVRWMIVAHAKGDQNRVDYYTALAQANLAKGLSLSPVVVPQQPLVSPGGKVPVSAGFPPLDVRQNYADHLTTPQVAEYLSHVFSKKTLQTVLAGQNKEALQGLVQLHFQAGAPAKADAFRTPAQAQVLFTDLSAEIDQAQQGYEKAEKAAAGWSVVAKLGAANKVYTKLPPEQQLNLGGGQQKYMVGDQFGNKYMFKLAPQPFRAEVEDSAHKIGALFGFTMASSSLETLGGKFGQVQSMVTGNNMEGADLTKLTPTQLTDVLSIHVLNRAIDDDDSHKGNFFVTPDGHVVAIDKGRAFARFGKYKMAYGQKSNSIFGTMVYDDLYHAIENGKYDQATVDAAYLAVLKKAKFVAGRSDDAYRAILETGLAHRPAGSYASRTTAGSKAELISQAVARKNALPEEFQAWWAGIYAKAGWTPPEPPAQLAPGIHTSIDADYLADVTSSKHLGHPVFFHGGEFEANNLMTRVTGTNQGDVYVATANVRQGADKVLTTWLDKQVTGSPMGSGGYNSYTPPPPATGSWNSPLGNIPTASGHFNIIVAGAKTVNHHAADGQYNDQSIAAVQSTKAKLEALSAEYAADPDAFATKHFGGKKVMAGQYAEMMTQYTAAAQQVLDAKDGKVAVTPHVAEYSYAAKPEPVPNAPALVVAAPPPPAAAPAFKVTVRTAGFHVGQALPGGGIKLIGEPKTESPYASGQEYLITMADGTEIEYQNWTSSHARKSQQGSLRIQTKNLDSTQVENALGILRQAGLNLEESTQESHELYYWVHLHSISLDRMPNATYKKMQDKAKALGLVRNDTDVANLAKWREAFAEIKGQTAVDEFVAEQGYLPEMQHTQYDLASEGGHGTPHWNRFDMGTAAEVRKTFGMLYRKSSGGNIPGIAKSGAMLSTEERERTSGVEKEGDSAAADQGHGSADLVYSRFDVQSSNYVSAGMLYLDPAVIRWTTSYAFIRDRYGEPTDRREYSPMTMDQWKHIKATSQSNNEVMPTGQVSLLQYARGIVFPNAVARQSWIDHMAAAGVTEYEGRKIADIAMVDGDTAKLAKIKADMKAGI